MEKVTTNAGIAAMGTANHSAPPGQALRTSRFSPCAMEPGRWAGGTPGRGTLPSPTPLQISDEEESSCRHPRPAMQADPCRAPPAAPSTHHVLPGPAPRPLASLAVLHFFLVFPERRHCLKTELASQNNAPQAQPDSAHFFFPIKKQLFNETQTRRCAPSCCT